MTASLRLATLGCILVLAAPAAALAQNSDDRAFTWEGAVAQGQWIDVRNINGSVTVQPGTGDRATITATKRWRRGNPADVRIELSRYGPGDGNVLVCALWGPRATCDESGYHSNGDYNSRDEIEVAFVVTLPRGVNVKAGSVNGRIRVDGATAAVQANTVNGTVEATSVGGPVTANTVNGDIRVRMASLGTGDLSYGTVNGSITVELPPQLDADLEMSTVNGSLDADYPLTLQGRINPRHLRATIGAGGRRLRFSTVNGSVRLQRASA